MMLKSFEIVRSQIHLSSAKGLLLTSQLIILLALSRLCIVEVLQCLLIGLILHSSEILPRLVYFLAKTIRQLVLMKVSCSKSAPDLLVCLFSGFPKARFFGEFASA